MGALRAGLVGTGFIGSVHARSIVAAGARLAGVAASVPEHGRTAATRLGAARAYDSGLDLARAPDIDVVHIATPNDSHADLVLAALHAGKHVVCEKPLSVSAVEAGQLADAATAHGAIAAIPFVNRFHPMAREARDQLGAGRHGTVRMIHGSYLQDWLLDPEQTNWRVDARRGGPSRAFADIGSHWCDLAEWLTGERITEVVASTATVVAARPVVDRATFTAPEVPVPGMSATSGMRRVPGVQPEYAGVDTEDVASVLFRTARAASGSVTVSQTAPGRKNRLWLQIDTDRHSVVFDQEEPDVLRIGSPAGSRVLAREPALLSAAARPYVVLPAGHAQGFHDCFDAFVRDVYRSIEIGNPVEGLPTFADGVRAAHLVEAVLASASKRAWVEVGP